MRGQAEKMSFEGDFGETRVKETREWKCGWNEGFFFFNISDGFKLYLGGKKILMHHIPRRFLSNTIMVYVPRRFLTKTFVVCRSFFLIIILKKSGRFMWKFLKCKTYHDGFSEQPFSKTVVEALGNHDGFQKPYSAPCFWRTFHDRFLKTVMEVTS